MKAKSSNTEIEGLVPDEGAKLKPWFMSIVKQMQPRDTVEFIGCDAGNLRSYLSLHKACYGGRFRTMMLPEDVGGVRVMKDK